MDDQTGNAPTDEQVAQVLVACVTRYGKGATDYAVDCHASGIR